MLRRWIPFLVVFTSSFCLFVLKLSAIRLVARHLGSSLETWAGVIGVLLAGVALGNALGGWMADRARPGHSAALMMALSAGLAIAAMPMNALAGAAAAWPLPWPAQVCAVIAIVLFPPSFSLGTLSPMATRLALAGTRPVGEIMGRIYAWGAAGSILGTYLSGFVLFSFLAVDRILFLTGAVLLGVALLTWLASD